MKIFVIEASRHNGYLLPTHDFGYTVIEAIKYIEWLRHQNEYDYILMDTTKFRCNCWNYLTDNHIPIGSIDFCIEWFKQMGIESIRPLNIPESLWLLCKREVKIDCPCNGNGFYMMKDINIIKSDKNMKVHLPMDNLGLRQNYFMSEWIDNVISEWRAFIYRGNVLGIKNYAGNPLVVPDIEYIDMIASTYPMSAYTLDVMMYNKILQNPTRRALITDILELHEFFGCGLYGFDDFEKLLYMHVAAVKNILESQ